MQQLVSRVGDPLESTASSFCLPEQLWSGACQCWPCPEVVKELKNEQILLKLPGMSLGKLWGLSLRLHSSRTPYAAGGTSRGRGALVLNPVLSPYPGGIASIVYGRSLYK